MIVVFYFKTWPEGQQNRNYLYFVLLKFKDHLLNVYTPCPCLSQKTSVVSEVH